MKTLVFLCAAVGFAVAFLFLLGKYSQKGAAPGLVDGSLTRCSGKPNCVCSEYEDDVDHYINSIKSTHQIDDLSKASATIQEMGGVINHESNHYIAATFASKLFGFVDDLEVRVDTVNGVMHIRSASRVGYGDGGVNRKRVEWFKKVYRKKLEY